MKYLKIGWKNQTVELESFSEDFICDKDFVLLYILKINMENTLDLRWANWIMGIMEGNLIIELQRI